MYGLWTSCLIVIMTYPGYLAWAPPLNFPYGGLLKSLYHLILFLIVQGPALPRRLNRPSAGVIVLSTVYWVLFFVAMFIKFYFMAPAERASYL